jgi:AcrR family transcriptional regulator
MAEIAARAGVGVGSLYRRFPSKDALAHRLCRDGMDAIADAARVSLSEVDDDPWGAFERFLRRAVDAGAGSLRGLAGTFRPDDELNRTAATMDGLISELISRAQALGAVRADIGTADVGLLFEMLRALRRRYLDLYAPALRAPAPGALTEPAATWAEVTGTWNP